MISAGGRKAGRSAGTTPPCDPGVKRKPVRAREVARVPRARHRANLRIGGEADFHEQPT
jgi:hypothetical protein